MASLLDARSQPVDRTAQLRSNSYLDAQDDLARKRLAEQEALRIAQEAAERAKAVESRAQAEEARRVAETTQKTQLPIAATDVMQWQLSNPDYQKPFHQLPPEAKQHFIDARTYDPAVTAQIPGLYNQTLKDTVGKIPGLDDMDVKGKSVDETTGKVTTTYIPKVDPEANGELTENQKTIADAIANYNQHPAQSLSKFHQSDREKIMAYVQTTNPAYDAKEFPVRQAARRDFTSGTSARNIKSLNQVVSHLDGLMEAADELKNSGFKPFNAAKNFYKEQTGNPTITKFDVNADAVAAELAKLMKGNAGVPAAGEIKEWRSQFHSDMSPEQLKAAIGKAIELMGGATDALRNQWQSAYDKPRELPFLDKKAQSVLRKFGVDPTSIDPGAGNTEPGSPDLPPAANAAAGSSAAAPAPVAPQKLSPQDQAAIDWANANPKDPRAVKIKALHGLQ